MWQKRPNRSQVYRILCFVKTETTFQTWSRVIQIWQTRPWTVANTSSRFLVPQLLSLIIRIWVTNLERRLLSLNSEVSCRSSFFSVLLALKAQVSHLEWQETGLWSDKSANTSNRSLVSKLLSLIIQTWVTDFMCPKLVQSGEHP